MLVAFINVQNLDKFLEYLKSKDVEVEEHTHIVLTDSSELEVIECRVGGVGEAYIVVHYIDSHYAALAELGENADDEEILKALLSVDRESLWRIPVEPVIYITNDYNFIRIVNKYSDEAPGEGRRYLEFYLSSTSSVLKVIDISSLLSIAYSLRGSENHGQTLRS